MSCTDAMTTPVAGTNGNGPRSNNEDVHDYPSSPSDNGQRRRTSQSRRLVDRNSPTLRVKPVFVEDKNVADSTANDSPRATTPSAVDAMIQREQERQDVKRRRRARRQRDAELKKTQISALTLKKTMLLRHWAKLEDKINNPPPPPAKAHKDAVAEPVDNEINAEYTHPSTMGYHTMKHLSRDATKIHPTFFEHPFDLKSARTALDPVWKRALARKRPLPLHPSLRTPCMIGYMMNAESSFDQRIISPIFYTYNTATGNHMDAEGYQSLVNQQASLFPHKPRFMWQLRNRLEPCFLCQKLEVDAPSDCIRCGRRKIGPADVKEQFNFVEAREVAASSSVADARQQDKEQLQIAKSMARVKYVNVVIKPMPMGRIVNLKVDNRSTMQYIYFLYRSNVGGELGVHSRVNLFLPTYKGVFFFDWKIVPETPTSFGSDAGYRTLSDYNVVEAGATVCLIESPTYRRLQCENLFNLYLTRNLVHDAGRPYNKDIQYFNDQLPDIIPHPEDFIQAAMRVGIKSMEGHMLDNEKKMDIVRSLEARARAKTTHEKQIRASQRFVERTRRLKDHKLSREEVAERKARMKARKREEREWAEQRRHQNAEVVVKVEPSDEKA